MMPRSEFIALAAALNVGTARAFIHSNNTDVLAAKAVEIAVALSKQLDAIIPPRDEACGCFSDGDHMARHLNEGACMPRGERT